MGPRLRTRQNSKTDWKDFSSTLRLPPGVRGVLVGVPVLTLACCFGCFAGVLTDGARSASAPLQWRRIGIRTQAFEDVELLGLGRLPDSGCIALAKLLRRAPRPPVL